MSVVSLRVCGRGGGLRARAVECYDVQSVQIINAFPHGIIIPPTDNRPFPHGKRAIPRITKPQIRGSQPKRQSSEVWIRSEDPGIGSDDGRPLLLRSALIVPDSALVVADGEDRFGRTLPKMVVCATLPLA